MEILDVKKILVLSMCLLFSSTMVLAADDGCCSWFWWRKPGTSITVSGSNSHMSFRFGNDRGCYKCRHHKKIKKHRHHKWRHRYDCDDCWDDD